MHRCGVILAGLLIGLSQVGLSQFDRSSPGASIPGGTLSNYRFAGPNELTITVSILGAVRAPGRYEISRTINLLDLIALAGGWREDIQGATANISEITVARFVQTASGIERREIILDLSTRSGLNEKYLTLQEGDFVYIPLSRAIDVDTVLRWITAIGVIITTYYVIQDRSRN